MLLLVSKVSCFLNLVHTTITIVTCYCWLKVPWVGNPFFDTLWRPFRSDKKFFLWPNPCEDKIFNGCQVWIDVYPLFCCFQVFVCLMHLVLCWMSKDRNCHWKKVPWSNVCVCLCVCLQWSIIASRTFYPSFSTLLWCSSFPLQRGPEIYPFLIQ